ncbi:MAG: sulfotransferase family protein [Myxococcota bacterium]
MSSPASPSAPGALPAAPFFIVGTGRCGSTLLQAMLLSHSRIAIPPETHFFAELDPALAFADPLPPGADDAYLDACVRALHWAELGLERDALARLLASGHRDARSIFGWVLARLLGDDGVRRSRVGEKTPRHEQNVPRIAALFPDARFIHIHRDPRDVVASILGMEWRSSDSVSALARECRRTYRRQRAFARELGPERYLEVCFEKLVAAPDTVLREVCAFLGEPFEEGMLRYAERAESGYLESESGWKAGTRQPLDASRIGRYRAVLRPRAIRRIEGLLADEMRELGYAPARAPLFRPDWWWASFREARRRQRSARA